MVSYWTMIAFLIGLRIASLFCVAPGNAPDEFGHLLIAAGTSQGHWVTLEDSRRYNTTYPYAVYCPVPYLPSAAALFVGAWFDPEINQLKPGMTHFTYRAVRVARLGALFWFGIYLGFLIALTRDRSPRERALALVFLGLLPQLTFVQTYVNLDSMGIAVFAYLVWALSRQRSLHLGFAVLLAVWSKMNYFCLLPLPAIVLAGRSWRRPRQLLQDWGLKLGVPVALGTSWFVLNYWVNTRPFGSWLGFSALNQMYPATPGGDAVLSGFFLRASLMSAFGYFGWMNQKMPTFFYIVWTLVVFLPGTVFLFERAFFSRGEAAQKSWHWGFVALFVTNFLLHYGASYLGSFQPQGRYLFPAVLTASGYCCYGLLLLSKRFRRFSELAAGGLAAFMVVSALWGLKISRENVAHFDFPKSAQSNG